jgi:tetratricopeptide (TPR) repeat protein
VNSPAGQIQQMALMDPKQIELAFWNSIMNSNNPADYEAYLEQYPTGSFAALAKNRLKTLSAAKPADSDRTVAPAQGISFTSVAQIVYSPKAGALYAAPDETAALISTTPPQTAVRAAGRSPDGAWWQVHLPNGRTAYAKAADIAEQPATEVLSADARTEAATPPAAEPPVAAEPPAAAEPVPATGDQTAATLPPDAVAKQHFDVGQMLFEQGDLDGARAAFDEAIAADPKYAEAHLRRSQVSLALDDVQSASADLGMAILYDPNNLEARSDLILVRLAAGEADAAVKAADELQQVDPTAWSINAVAAYYLADRLDDALAMAERITSHQPTFAPGWIWQSMVMKAQGRDGEAFDLLQAGMDAVGNHDWPVPVMEWMLGKRQTARLIEVAKSGPDKKTSLRQMAEMSFFVGESLKTEDPQQAEGMLSIAAQAKTPDLLACAAARALLVKLQK